MQKSTTILVIDDDPTVLQLLDFILTLAGHTVLSAFDGEEALELCAQAGDKIDLAICDVMMPGLSGPEVLAALRERIPGLPAILVSGFPGGQQVVAAGDRFIEKPFRPTDIVNAVNGVLVPALRSRSRQLERAMTASSRNM